MPHLSHRVKATTALLAALCVASINTTPLLAAASGNKVTLPSGDPQAQSQNHWVTSTAQAIEHINESMPRLAWPEFQRTWETISSGRNRILTRAASTRVTSPVDAVMDIGVLMSDTERRNLAVRLATDPDKSVARRGSRLLTWLDIASAKSPGERHEKIRRLPVSVIESKVSPEGRIQKEFVHL